MSLKVLYSTLFDSTSLCQISIISLHGDNYTIIVDATNFIYYKYNRQIKIICKDHLSNRLYNTVSQIKCTFNCNLILSRTIFEY